MAQRFNANQIYWRALCDILRESGKEAAEINAFFVSWLKCFGDYNDAATALLQSNKRTERNSKKLSPTTVPRAAQTTDLVTVSPHDMLLQLEQTIAARRKEFCDWLRVNVVEGQPHHMQEEFVRESVALIAQGEQCLRELMAAEDFVQHCYKK